MCQLLTKNTFQYCCLPWIDGVVFISQDLSMTWKDLISDEKCPRQESNPGPSTPKASAITLMQAGPASDTPYT